MFFALAMVASAMKIRWKSESRPKPVQALFNGGASRFDYEHANPRNPKTAPVGKNRLYSGTTPRPYLYYRLPRSQT